MHMSLQCKDTVEFNIQMEGGVSYAENNKQVGHDAGVAKGYPSRVCMDMAAHVRAPE